MKMYLSSFKLGDYTDKLLALLDGKTRVGVIMAAQDYKDTETRAERLQEELNTLIGLGLKPEELDLRDYFVDNSGLSERLALYDLIWVRGGNVFLLRKALAQSGADILLRKLIKDETIVYGGYSAGVCVLGPTLHGFELVDNENIYVPDYCDETIWDGLGILPYSVAPHYRSDHYESEAIEKVVAYFEHHNSPFKTLRDGDVIVIDGDS